MIHDTWSTIVFFYPIFGRNQLQRVFSVQWIPFRMNRTLKLLSWRGWASDRFCGSSTDYWWFDQLKSKYVMLVVKWVVKWMLNDKLLWNGLFFASDSSLFPSISCSHWTSFDKKATSNWQQPLLRALDVARGAPQAGVPSYAESSLPGSPGNLSATEHVMAAEVLKTIHNRKKHEKTQKGAMKVINK